jgi:hypothetical protein
MISKKIEQEGSNDIDEETEVNSQELGETQKLEDLEFFIA